MRNSEPRTGRSAPGAREFTRRELLKKAGALGILCAGGSAALATGLVGCESASKRREEQGGKGAKPFKFAHVTDSHVSTQGRDGVALKKRSAAILEDVVEQLDRTDGLDFCLFGGDNFDNSEVGRKDADAFVAIVGKLKVPFFIQFGNREASSLPPGDPVSKNEFVKMFSGNGFAAGALWWGASPVEGVRVLGIDTSIQGRSDGAVPAEEIAWMEKELAAHADDTVIVLAHHLFLPTWAPRSIPKWRKKYVISNADEVMTILKRSRNVKLVLSGHHHVTKIDLAGDLPYVATPATVQFPCAFRTFDVRDGGATPGFHQVRDQKTLDLGRDLLVKGKQDEYGSGPGPQSVDEYCLGQDRDREARIALRGT